MIRFYRIEYSDLYDLISFYWIDIAYDFYGGIIEYDNYYEILQPTLGLDGVA